MRAEHAAVDVRLVHDDVAQVREHVAPAVVMRQDADVEHVRVREDEVRPAADLPAPLARRVAVVDRGARARELERGERARLILRERLRRVEVERPQLRVARDRVEHGQVERERLPRRGAGRDDDVLAAARGVPGLALVLVERVERERGADARVQVVGQRREPRLARRLAREVRELLALEQVVPTCGLDGHASILAPDVKVPSATLSRTDMSGLTQHVRTRWRSVLASAYRGASTTRLRTHPSNLIRLVPAKGVTDRPTRTDHRLVRLGRRRRHPGRPEGVRGRGLPRDERDRGAHGAEHRRASRRSTSCRRSSSRRSSTPSSTTSASTRRRPGCSSPRA